MHQKCPWELLYVSLHTRRAHQASVRTWTELVDLVLAIARVELFAVQFSAVCIYGQYCHDLLLHLVCAGDIEFDLLGGAVKFYVQLVDLDISRTVQTGAEAVGLENVGSQYAQWRRCQ